MNFDKDYHLIKFIKYPNSQRIFNCLNRNKNNLLKIAFTEIIPSVSLEIVVTMYKSTLLYIFVKMSKNTKFSLNLH